MIVVDIGRHDEHCAPCIGRGNSSAGAAGDQGTF